MILKAAIALSVLVFACIGGCGTRTTIRNAHKTVVVAGIAPLAYFTRRVGGDFVEVELLVPPAANPHIYQPDPRQMKKLARASVLVLNGLGVEFWASKAVGAVDNPALITVYTSDGLPLIGGDEKGHGANPHVWLDPICAAHQVKLIEGALEKADPKHAKEYRLNAERLVSDLYRLDNDISQAFRNVKSRAFVSSHPAWTYFARRYGLSEVAVIEKSPGREPSPADIRRIIELVKRRRVGAIFVERQYNSKAAETIAEETGAKLVVLDPLGMPPDYDYFKMMRRNVAAILEAMR
ncbi:MAG: metal ABC transporter substrate-binding protein [Armatimonadota bacterium]|nr:metal ABC transporter substrate-binding protein [Armatimonadota bacterium]